MGIQPIDLQTLYTQMEKVGKQKASEEHLKENAIEKQQEEARRQDEKKVSSVHKTEPYDKVRLSVNEDAKNKGSTPNKKAPPTDEQDSEKPKTDYDQNYITDPELGQKVDFSG